MKIGVTERGDAGLDFSWVNKLYDANIIISKNLNDKLIQHLVENKEKIIYHMTCTGYGSTVLEPNVPRYEDIYNQVCKLIKDDFPKEQIVLRIDPIIPTEKGLRLVSNILFLFKETGIKRVRYSFMDMYKHVKERFLNANVKLPYDTFTCPLTMIKDCILTLEKYSGIYEFEACAENTPHKTGCISQKDLDILGIDFKGEIGGHQRKQCICLSGKTELLSSKTRCPHKCLYCYWRD